MPVSHIALFASVGNMTDSHENMTVGHVGIGSDIANLGNIRFEIEFKPVPGL